MVNKKKSKNNDSNLFFYEDLKRVYEQKNIEKVIQDFLKYDFCNKSYYLKTEENILVLTKWLG